MDDVSFLEMNPTNLRLFKNSVRTCAWVPMQNFWIVFKLHSSAGVPVIKCLCLPVHMTVCLATVFVLTLVCIYS